MPLETTQLDIPLLGLDTGKEPLRTNPGAMSELTNGEFTSDSTIAKRTGFVSLGQTGLPTGFRGLLKAGDRLVAMGLSATNTLRAYSEDRDEWVNADDPSLSQAGAGTEAYLSCSTLGRQVYGLFSVNLAFGGVPPIDVDIVQGCEIYVLRTSNVSTNGRILIFERSRNQLIMNQAISSNMSRSLVGHAGSKVIAVTHITATTIRFHEMTLPASATTLDGGMTATDYTPSTSPANLPNDPSVMDICSDDQNSCVWVAYRDSSNTLSLIKRTSSTTTVYTSAITVAGAICVYKHPDQNFLYIGFAVDNAGNDDGKVCTFDITNTTFSSATTIVSGWQVAIYHCGIVKASSTTAWVCFDGEPSSSTFEYAIQGEFVNSTPSIQTAAFSKEKQIRNSQCTLAGRPIFCNSRVYLPIARLGTPFVGDNNLGPYGHRQDQLVQIKSPVGNDTITAQPIALLATDESPGYRTPATATVAAPLPHTPEITAGEKFLFALAKAERFDQVSGDYSLKAVEITMGTSIPKLVEAAGVTYLTGGYLGSLSETIVPSTPLLGPVLLVTTEAAALGSLVPSTTYQWVGVVEYSGLDGAVHRGPPGPIVSRTLGGTTVKATLSVYHGPSSRYPYGSARLHIYRTESNGGNFFLEATYTEHISSHDSTISDATLRLRAGFDGHEDGVSSDPVPGALDIAFWNNRLWVLSSLLPHRVYFSKEVTQGIAAQFNADMFVDLGSNTQGVGISALDNALVVHTQNAIYAITGDGPNNNNENGSFSSPIQIHSGVGLSTKEASIVIPQGVLFQSYNGQGFRLLGKDFQLSQREDGRYFGSEADSYRSATIVAAHLIPWKNQARFVDNAGNIIVFDYQLGRWSVFSYGSGGLSVTVSSAVQWATSHVLVVARSGTTKPMRQNASTTYADDGTFVKLICEFDWLSFAGISGFQRCRRGTWVITQVTNVPMTVTVKVDAFSNQVISWTEAAIAALGSEDRLQAHITNQKCTRMRLRVEDSAPAAGTPEGYKIHGCQLEVGVLKGQGKLPAANRKG